jgi:hypothetical protein
VSGAYDRMIDGTLRAFLTVRWRTVRDDVVSYAVVLSVETDDRRQTVRVYDSAHGFNEMHRHTATGGKQAGEVFHHGSLGEGMRTAIAECMDRYEAMIEAWQR